MLRVFQGKYSYFEYDEVQKGYVPKNPEIEIDEGLTYVFDSCLFQMKNKKLAGISFTIGENSFEASFSDVGNTVVTLPADSEVLPSENAGNQPSLPDYPTDRSADSED